MTHPSKSLSTQFEVVSEQSVPTPFLLCVIYIMCGSGGYRVCQTEMPDSIFVKKHPKTILQKLAAVVSDMKIFN